MSDQMRWRYGDAQPVVSKPVPSATVIEIGDIITDTPAPAAGVANAGLVHDSFLGVSAQRSRSGETDPVRVNTRGVHEFDCAAATFNLGDLVGNVAGESQTVVGVADETTAIGKVAKQYDSATTKVYVEITSVVLHGGPQAEA